MRNGRHVAVLLLILALTAACTARAPERATEEAQGTFEAQLAETEEAATRTAAELPRPTDTEPPPTTALVPPPTVPRFDEPAPEGEDLLEKVLAGGRLVVSTDPNYAPQSFVNDAGQMDGFDVDVAKSVAARLAIQVEFVTPDWDVITAGNWGGRWDVSIGSMTPTAERAQVLWFSDAYYYVPASFATHTDNTTIQTVDDLAGKTVGLGVATTYEAYLKGDLAIMGGEIIYDPPPGIKIWQYLTDAEAFEDMELGDGVRLDAVMSAQPTIQDAMDAGVPLKYLGTPAFYEPLAFALDRWRGPSQRMLAQLNQIIADMHADGTLSTLSKKWYGIDITTITPVEAPTSTP
jgi:polar amino acid transport system substrate-binding protein